MKSRLIAAGVALACLATPLFAADAMGVWATEKNDDGNYLTVEIKPCGEKVCGYIVGAHEADGTLNDGYEHLGKPMVTDMVADGENAWDGGEIWDPSEDKRYSSNMELKGDVLTVEGCVLIICRGQDWTRVN